MRMLCDVCEAAAAHFFCAADEAVLCRTCDEKVHGCNKLASRHLRLHLTEAKAVPHCDICGSAPAFFFCGIDGTSLCLQCDTDVHIGGKKTHERYLLIGQRVELNPNRYRNEGEAGIKRGESAKDERRTPFHEMHHHHHLHDRRDLDCKKKFRCNAECHNGNAPIVAVAEGAIRPTDGHGIDLNFRPVQSRSQLMHLGNVGKENEQVSSSDDGCLGLVPKDTSTSD